MCNDRFLGLLEVARLYVKLAEVNDFYVDKANAVLLDSLKELNKE